VPISRENGPVSDMGKLLPHTGGREQLLAHRLRSCSLRCTQPREQLKHVVTHEIPYLTDEDFDATGIYYAKVHYADDLPAEWDFGADT